MFDLLKKKLSSFTEKLRGAIEKKEAAPRVSGTRKEILVAPEAGIPKAEIRKAEKETEIKTGSGKKLGEGLQDFREVSEKAPKETGIEESPAEKKEKIPEESGEENEAEEEIEAWAEPERRETLKIKPEKKRLIPFFGKGETERELKAKPSLKTKVLSVFSAEIKVEERDIAGFLEELELELLESDVEQNTAIEIISLMKKELVGKSFSKSGDLTRALKGEIRVALEKAMDAEKIDLFGEMQKKKPYIILFLGPNGAGKTTTIAKIASLMQKRGKKSIIAAADTFRAASIEQIELHGQRLGIRVVKHDYGSDPTAVAFDAVKAAEAGNYDVVLIDSAGRQETNRNLINELRKMGRVIKPDLKVFVGEALAGKSLLNQAIEFDREVGLDAFILSKIDTDAKGGTAISLLHNLRKPILFVGTGQEYKDLAEFSPKFILDRILAEEAD
ncbi:MAG: signal recognition particle-docking protein FtsY [archaeon]